MGFISFFVISSSCCGAWFCVLVMTFCFCHLFATFYLCVDNSDKQSIFDLKMRQQMRLLSSLCYRTGVIGIIVTIMLSNL